MHFSSSLFTDRDKITVYQYIIRVKRRFASSPTLHHPSPSQHFLLKSGEELSPLFTSRNADKHRGFERKGEE